MAEAADRLDELVAAVLASGKYRALSPALIRAIGTRELATQPSYRAALKATRSRLHQVVGAFLDRAPRYNTWLAALRDAAGNRERIQAVCRSAMDGHASTRERLPELERFYAAVFATLPPVTRLMDLACGLNPLATPWMPLPQPAHYLACDVYSDLCSFVGTALPLLGLSGEAALCDLTAGPPPWRADVALVLKTLPVLEQLRRGAGRELLRGIEARYLVVSFPTRSLGGRNVGMAATYSGYMQTIVTGEGWTSQTLAFANELVFVVRKG